MSAPTKEAREAILTKIRTISPLVAGWVESKFNAGFSTYEVWRLLWQIHDYVRESAMSMQDEADIANAVNEGMGAQHHE